MIIKSIILGIVQGLTEFLPISSSGHLAVLENYFGISEPVALAVFLHFGTFVATVVFFFKPMRRIIQGFFKKEKESIYYVINIVVGTIPIVVFALTFKTYIEHAFSNIKIVAIFLGITGAILLLTGIVQKKEKKVNFLSAIVIGISQMFATLPGISRSGITISTGMFNKVNPREAFNFSFLLSLPAILGANIFEASKISRVNNLPSIIIGMICSFIFGLIALKILRNTVHKRFHLFGIYCLAISLILLIVK
jgi:undecaprenyl-diphosphatase